MKRGPGSAAQPRGKRKQRNPAPKTTQPPSAAGSPPSDTVAAAGALAFTVAGLFLIGWLIPLFYHPDIGLLLQEVSRLVMPARLGSVVPEPVERLQFIATTLMTPPLILAGLVLSKRLLSKTQSVPWLNVERFMGMAGAVVMAWLFYICIKRSDFLYIRSSALYDHPVVFALWIFPLWCLLVYFSNRRFVVWIGRITLILLAVGSAVITVLTTRFDADALGKFNYHLNPVLYPVAQVVAGKTLLVDSVGLYGLYAHFLEPLFRVIPLSVLSFTTVCGVMVASCHLLVLGSLRVFCRNLYVLIASYAAVVFYSYFGPKLFLSPGGRPDPYLQYAPLRMVVPCLCMFCFFHYAAGPKRRWLYALCWVLAAAGLLWNPDSGLVVFITTVICFAYLEFHQKPARVAVKASLLHCAAGAASAALVFSAYTLFACLRGGHLPDWALTARYYKLFSHYGYFMLPMPGPPHMWAFVALILVGGLVVCLNGLWTRSNPAWNAGLLFCVLLGIGLFGYYQGRSHDNNIFGMLYLPVMVVSLLADRIFESLHEVPLRQQFLLPLALVFLFYLSAAAPSPLFHMDRLAQWSNAGTELRDGGTNTVRSTNTAFLRQHLAPAESIFVLLPGDLDGLYYAETHTKSPLLLPSSTDWFFVDNIRTVLNFLNTNRTDKIVAVPGQFPELNELFRQNYLLQAQNPETSLAIYVPRPLDVPPAAR